MDKIDRRTIGRVAAAGVGVGLLALLRGERTALAATPDGSLAQLQDVLIPIEAFVDTANDPATNGGTWDLVIADAIAEAGTVGPPVAGRGFTLAFGSKTYKFANTIVISAPMRLIGQGLHLSTSLGSSVTPGTLEVEGGTVLDFPNDNDGIDIRFTTSPTPSGQSVSLQGLCIRGPWRRFGSGSETAAPGASVGIRVRASHVSIRNVNVECFSGDGILLGADEGENSDNWHIETSMTSICGGHGLHAAPGKDSSAGLAMNVHAHSVLGWGFLDESFLGNTFIACHASNNGTRGTGGDTTFGGNYARPSPPGTASHVAGSTFLGCYGEGDSFPSLGLLNYGKSDISHPSVVIGGLLSTKFDGTGGGIASRGPQLTAQNGLTFEGSVSGAPSEKLRLMLGFQVGASQRVLRLVAPDPLSEDGLSLYAMDLEYSASSATTGWWSTVWGGQSSTTPGVALSQNVVNWVDTGRKIPPNVAMFGPGYFVGNIMNSGEQRVFVETGSGPPDESALSSDVQSSYDFERPVGSQVLSLDPATSGCVGWVKVSAGKGATHWSKFGALIP